MNVDKSAWRAPAGTPRPASAYGDWLDAKADKTRTGQPATVPTNDNAEALPGAVGRWPRGSVQYDALPSMGTGGKPLATIENLAEICNRLNVKVYYNVIAKKRVIELPGKTTLLDERDNAAFAELESQCAHFGMPTEKINGFLTAIANDNPFNPVGQWITSKPWDGAARLQQLCDTITPVEDKRLPDGRPLKDVLVRRWMMSAIAAAFSHDGVSAHGILVFQGAQYLGKTMWFKQLVPAELGLLQDGMMLNPSDKDSVKQAVSFWLVELGELDATFRKADLAALKSFVTRKQDVLRLPYARTDSHFARRTVFFGSVNPREFLHDITGNRRYWTIECAAIDLDAQRQLDMQQVWAEAYALWQAGEGHFLTADEMAALNASNEEFQAVDPVEERLQSRLDWDAPAATWGWRSATEILISVGLDKPTIADATKAAHILRKMNGGQAKRSGGKKQLLCPPKSGSWMPDDDRPF